MSLPAYHLVFERSSGQWRLVSVATGVTMRRFQTKAQATVPGVIEQFLGRNGGSVRIHDENGRFEEERTYPRSADPRRSPG